MLLQADRLAIDTDFAQGVVDGEIVVMEGRFRAHAEAFYHHWPPVFVIPGFRRFPAFLRICRAATNFGYIV